MLIAIDSPETTFGDGLRELASPFDYLHGYYVRVADPVGFLDSMRPILSQRLAGSDFADATGTVEISMYTNGLALDYDRGEVGPIRAIPGLEDPTDVDGIGVAPDWFPALVFGRWCATELADRVDDVIVSRDRRLMDVLFPERAADVAADF
jgi:hypothetical protein